MTPTPSQAPDDPICAKCDCYRSAHIEDGDELICSPTGWRFTAQAPDEAGVVEGPLLLSWYNAQADVVWAAWCAADSSSDDFDPETHVAVPNEEIEALGNALEVLEDLIPEGWPYTGTGALNDEVRAALSPPPVVEEAGLAETAMRTMAGAISARVREVAGEMRAESNDVADAMEGLADGIDSHIDVMVADVGRLLRIAPTPTAGEEAVERLRKIERDHLAHLDGMIDELASRYDWDDQKKEAERTAFRRQAAISLNFRDFQAVLALASLSSPSGLTIPDKLREEGHELIDILRERIDQDYDGECHLSGAEADRLTRFIRQALDQDPRG